MTNIAWTACAFCDGQFGIGDIVGEGDEVECALVHSTPVCSDFLRIPAEDFMDETLKKQASELGS